jgi:hypothetical protein
MAIHIERMTSEVSLQDGELSLTPAQVERVVALVLTKLEERARESRRTQAATKLRRHAARSLDPED